MSFILQFYGYQILNIQGVFNGSYGFRDMNITEVQYHKIIMFITDNLYTFYAELLIVWLLMFPY